MFALAQKEHGNVKHHRKYSENSNIDNRLQHLRSPANVLPSTFRSIPQTIE
jgi:hypothetical protein